MAGIDEAKPDPVNYEGEVRLPVAGSPYIVDDGAGQPLFASHSDPSPYSMVSACLVCHPDNREITARR